MKYLKSYQLFERKGNYQLFHKITGGDNSLISIIKDGFLKSGEMEWWNSSLRKNVIHNWEKNKFPTISATRNLNYLWLPALELDVEKISDRYKIIPFSENPDFYLDFDDLKIKPANNKNLTIHQNKIRSKDTKSGKLFWRTKTDKSADDYGIEEELILTDKLDIGKYVKRILLDRNDSHFNNKVKNLIDNKYPHIEVLEISKKLGYSDIKMAIKEKEKEKQLIPTY